MFQRLVLTAFLIIVPICLSAESRTVTESRMPQDSIMTDNDSIVPAKRNLVQKIIHYFDETNKPRTDKKLDFSIIGGPSYSNDTKLSIGLIGAALYKSRYPDSNTPVSNASIYSEISITGFYLVGIKGNHIGPGDKYRINYKVYFNSFPSKFWGIGFENNDDDSNETEYLKLNSSLAASIEFKLADNLYIGPAVHFNYSKAKDNDDWRLWEGESLSTTNYGIGFNVSYDSRDVITNPYSGWYIGINQRFYPGFMHNKYSFGSTDFTAGHYRPVWKGCILAAQFHSMMTYGDTPWDMLATLGGSHTMRGYYEGRYRDKNAMDITVELRQHVWRRNSVVGWVGAGTVFPKFSQLHSREILPNFGIGYRWEFKERVNVRVDYGFGKGQSGLVFNINEAF